MAEEDGACKSPWKSWSGHEWSSSFQTICKHFAEEEKVSSIGSLCAPHYTLSLFHLQVDKDYGASKCLWSSRRSGELTGEPQEEHVLDKEGK